MSLLPSRREFRGFGRNFFDNDDFFDNVLATNSIKTDIKESDEDYTLEAELPGFNKDNINVDYANNVLAISAQQTDGKDETDENDNYIRRERSSRSFSRQFLIQNIDESNITATYEDGVLTINLPKETPEAPQSRRIDIQ